MSLTHRAARQRPGPRSRLWPLPSIDSVSILPLLPSTESLLLMSRYMQCSGYSSAAADHAGGDQGGLTKLYVEYTGVTRAVNGILLSQSELRGHSSTGSAIYPYVPYEMVRY